ncbi:MAG: hypothetical protein NWQ54_07135 [Paraglaciecola sp.]|uniref:hypothetical protein n=1 Tax=Pseudomonadati TaxID=3379134 RepID=UPI00273D2B18|nr:hypothetical protein [Paraglaciecola sp.]MDP5032454.1 hypothetical protein [Paraglaciecola sp.]MDP5040888.1 hypothetical protein [Paraglaciecola sp.]MDP5130640.1 hypothetical protein [Paraglaciecola sp.]
MKKRHNMVNRTRFTNTSRRRQLIKRLHQKVNIRRQQFQICESTNDLAEAC